MTRKTILAAAFLILSSSTSFAAINAADYGVSASNGDNAAALQRAFDAAGPGEEVIIPNGRIAYGRQLRIDSARVRGSGGTVLAPSNPANQRIFMTGNGPSISNMRIDYHPIHRNGSETGRAGIWVQEARNFNVSGIVQDGAAYGVPATRGMGGSGIFVHRSQGGTIRNNTISYTKADSIHITNGTSDVEVTGNRIVGSGDDGIATVDYGGGVRNIRIDGNTVLDNRWGRGITAVGSSDVRITNNFIDGNRTDGAGVYIASERGWGIGAPRNILVQGNTIQDTGGRGKGHGQIMVANGGGAPSNIRIQDNEVRNSKTPQHAVVLSGSMNNVTLEGNTIDGEIVRRNGGSFTGSGNTTNDPRMNNPAPVPEGTPPPMGGGGGGDWGGEPDGEGEEAVNNVISNAGNFTGACSGTTGLSSAISAGAGIASIASGGRATAALQIAQQAQLIAQRICQTEQLMTMLENLKKTPLNTAGAIQSAMAQLRSMLGTTDATIYNQAAAMRAYGELYPNDMSDMTIEEVLGKTQEWREVAHEAVQESWRVQSAAVQAQEASSARVGQQLAAVQTAPGMLAAQQATAQLIGSLIGDTQAMQTVTMSHFRAVENQIAKSEAKTLQAEELHRRAMENLGANSTVEVMSPY
jgi:P-type conjugative transfer protein TrbJ